jgi:hypothetical protein
VWPFGLRVKTLMMVSNRLVVKFRYIGVPDFLFALLLIFFLILFQFLLSFVDELGTFCVFLQKLEI